MFIPNQIERVIESLFFPYFMGAHERLFVVAHTEESI
jgi:hypothetical protein